MSSYNYRIAVTEEELSRLFKSAIDCSDYDLALEHAMQITSDFPQSLQGWRAATEILVMMGRPDEALERLGGAIDAFPGNAKLISLARNLANDSGNVELAIHYAVRLHELIPENPKNLVFLVNGLIECNDASRARVYLNNLIEHYPNEPRTPALAARVSLLLGESAKAKSILDEGLVAHANDISVLSNLMDVALKNGDLADPAVIASSILAIKPDDVRALSVMLSIAEEKGDFDSALQWSSSLLAADSGRLKWLKIKARALSSLDNHEEALELLRSALDRHAADQALLAMARDTAHRAAFRDEAMRYAQALRAIVPNDPANNVFLATAAMQASEFENVLEISDTLIQGIPANPAGWSFRAQALAAMLRVSEALDTLDQGRASIPDGQGLMRQQMKLAFQHGRFDESQALAKCILEASPEDADAHLYLVQSLMGLGQLGPAKECLDTAVSPDGQKRLEKLTVHYRMMEDLRASLPELVDAWLAALRNGARSLVARSEGPPVVMIQYWSQGSPPRDVAYITDIWRRILGEEEIGTLSIFDRRTGREWIEENAPSFLKSFDGSFDYAMESDIFRIAYASIFPCIYMDVDSWPLPNSAEIIRYGISLAETLLCLRSSQPWIINGFFVSKPKLCIRKIAC